MRSAKKKRLRLNLLQVFDADNKRFLVRVGKDRSMRSYNIMVRARKYVADYLKEWEHREDIPIEDLQLDFIQRFSVYLSVVKGLHGGTIWLNCMVLKGVVQRAYKRGLLNASPFAEFHIAKNIRERQFLTEEEIMKLLSHTFEQPMQAYTRDIFLFSVFTGMSFIDICGLQRSDIQRIDGHEWIVSKRHKTGIPFRVRLLEQPLSIIHRYETADRELIFDWCKYHTIAKRLPAVLEECGINKHVTFHCARHTFAIMALNQGMPIESVSHILGHSNITTTQIYARVTMRKLDMDFLRLEHGLAPMTMMTNQNRVIAKVKKSILYFLHLLKKNRSKC